MRRSKGGVRIGLYREVLSAGRTFITAQGVKALLQCLCLDINLHSIDMRIRKCRSSCLAVTKVLTKWRMFQPHTHTHTLIHTYIHTHAHAHARKERPGPFPRGHHRAAFEELHWLPPKLSWLLDRRRRGFTVNSDVRKEAINNKTNTIRMQSIKEKDVI